MPKIAAGIEPARRSLTGGGAAAGPAPARTSGAATRASSTWNVDPSPGTLSTRTVPPSDSTIWRTIQSPSPKPP